MKTNEITIEGNGETLTLKWNGIIRRGKVYLVRPGLYDMIVDAGSPNAGACERFSVTQLESI